MNYCSLMIKFSCFDKKKFFFLHEFYKKTNIGDGFHFARRLCMLYFKSIQSQRKFWVKLLPYFTNLFQFKVTSHSIVLIVALKDYQDSYLFWDKVFVFSEILYKLKVKIIFLVLII